MTTLPSVDSVGCPALSESGDGKILHASYLRAHASLTHSITVQLRAPAWDPPTCPEPTSEVPCAALDAALAQRQAVNEKEVGCVLDAFGPRGTEAHARWYEPPLFAASGRPVPIGTAFSTLALWSQIEGVARQPYVEAIEPAFGEAARIAVAAPPVPAECPLPNDEPMGKLADAASVQGAGRKPVVIELRQGLLPPLQSCQSEDPCDEFLNSGWSRTIAGQRMLTCVRTFVDSKLQGPAADVDYSAGDGALTGYPTLPPFGDIIHAQTAFALTLTWEELLEVARHPYVERIWTSPGLTESNMPAGCPPNYEQPVTNPVCPLESEPTTGKYSAASMAKWAASTGVNRVVIAVFRDYDLCPQPDCPTRGIECPELTRYQARLTEEAQASQTCVRSLIASIGGTTSSEIYVEGNGMEAFLTWSQIQTVAAHPHVLQIDPSDDGTVPP